MSQYGKNDYWEDRYTKYRISYPEILNPSTGIRGTADSKTSSPLTSIKLTKFSMPAQAIPDLASKCLSKDTTTSPILTFPTSASKP